MDHVIVVNETGLRRILKSYFEYYERTRTYLSLRKDSPVSWAVQQVGKGRIVEILRSRKWGACTIASNESRRDSAKPILSGHKLFGQFPHAVNELDATAAASWGQSNVTAPISPRSPTYVVYW